MICSFRIINHKCIATSACMDIFEQGVTQKCLVTEIDFYLVLLCTTSLSPDLSAFFPTEHGSPPRLGRYVYLLEDVCEACRYRESGGRGERRGGVREVPP